MTITDLDGKEMTVTDLHLAVIQADDYRHYRVSEPSPYQLYLYKYWEDVYQKLLLLDTETQSEKYTMLRFTTGNLLDSSAEALVNTVNTVGVMGKGIALQFKQAFPHNYEIYRQACLNGSLQTGQLLTVTDTDLLMGERLIINFPTKRHWKSPSTYEYVETGLVALVNYLKTKPIKSLAMPALGCGNGGLDWKLVKPMIEKHLAGLDLSIWIYEPQIKGGN